MTSRRRFLINSSLVATGAALSSAASTLHKRQQKPLAVGIIGTGDRGQGLASLIKGIEGIDVVALCDVLPFRLEKALSAYGSRQTKSYGDYRKLLEDPRLDAVIIATPFGMHAEMAMDAIEADKHIYCEKTLSYGFEPTKKLLQKVKGFSKVFQTGHQYHSSRLYRHVVKLVREDEIGDISHIACQWNRNGNWRRPVPDPKWERMINWRMYREYSGGLTAELCSHQIDFANWLLEDHPMRVTGFGGIDYWKDGRETYDNIHLITEYANGVKATYTSLTTNAKDNYQVKVLGKKGSIVITEEAAWLYKEEEVPEKDYGIVDGVSGATARRWNSQGVALEVKHKDPTAQALIDFRDNIVNERKPLSDGRTGGQVAIVVQMALNAMDNKTVEDWKESYNFI